MLKVIDRANSSAFLKQEPSPTRLPHLVPADALSPQPGVPRIKLFQDCSDFDSIVAARAKNLVVGFTTNPTLMRKAGITDYKAFAQKIIAAVPDLPISFEVFSDDFDTMEREAREIASWGGNTYIKLPITNTKGESAGPLIRKLSSEGLSLNVTAILTLEQIEVAADAVRPNARTIISVFAGRIADTGVDPVPIMIEAHGMLRRLPRAELLWASTRELLNVVQAADCGCHIITATPDIIAKLPLIGKDLESYSIETVKMFHDDARAAGFRLV
jgi:transaldolase